MRALLIAVSFIFIFPIEGNAGSEIVMRQGVARIVNVPATTVSLFVDHPTAIEVVLLKRNAQVIVTGKNVGCSKIVALGKDGFSVGESVIRVEEVQTIDLDRQSLRSCRLERSYPYLVARPH